MELHEILHSAKEAINRTRKQPVKGISANTTDRPISKQANSKRKQPDEKMGKGLRQYFLDFPSRPEALTTNNIKLKAGYAWWQKLVI